jgi:hypothetical protein
MLRAKTILLVAILVACVVVFAAPAASRQSAQKAGVQPCPDMKQMFVNRVEVRQVDCSQARRVIVRYTRAIIDNLQHDWSVTVLGFHCDLTKKDYYGDSHRCTKGAQAIRFRRGTHS